MTKEQEPHAEAAISRFARGLGCYRKMPATKASRPQDFNPFL
jgi:hypothetical protein